ncbi:putative F-box/FBD/LRR-repeat protein [Camellia lanceoleosa]|uniref:F-box/FBD/LRR-repeat protein n=1 Tax=Camellia lanceoleosa TaxID=1840588 RepID=A0ACC0HJU1_9ERIC|nr:putative F-box/FBD/LRR-repeat protein [Camellia lanceoleosa]
MMDQFSKLSDSKEKDRISNLPDAILSHILCFMPTKYAARTSLLSTRWKSIWTSVHIIDLDSLGERCHNEQSSGFMDFVDRLLLLRNSENLNKFRLQCRYGFFSKSHGPPSSFIDILDDDSFQNILSGCPVLEELDIERTDLGDNIKTLCICSSTLKKLRIYNCFVRVTSLQHSLVIKAPVLEIFQLDDMYSVFDVDELPSLVKVNFTIYFDDDRSKDYYNGVVGMLGKISKVQHLELRHVIPKGHKNWQLCLWSEEPETVPKCLSLCLEAIEFSGFAGYKGEMQLVRYLLGNAMVLKKLTITSWTRNKKIKANVLKFPRGSSTCQLKLLYHSYPTYRKAVEWL